MTKARANKIKDAFKHDHNIHVEVIRDVTPGYRFNWRDGGWDVRITHALPPMTVNQGE